MASLVAILDLKGRPLIQRMYRDDVPESCVGRFVPILLELEDEGRMETPCFSKDGVNFMYIGHLNLYRESGIMLFDTGMLSPKPPSARILST
jgi:AP-1 complex subunit mu